MSSIIEAKNGMRALAAKAKDTVSDDQLTNAEKKTILDQVDVDLKAFAETISIHEQAQRLMSGGESAPEEKGDAAEQTVTKSFGRQVIDSDGYKAMQSGQSRGVTVELKVAATIDEGVIPAYSGGAGLAGQLTAPQFLPGIVPLKFQPLTVEDLLSSGTTSTSSISYVIESAFQDLTATVLEKGTKPQLDLTLARRQDNVQIVANVAKVTDEMFADAPQFQSYLQNRMIFGVRRVKETNLLNGNGTPPNLQGLLNRTGLATAVVTVTPLTALKAMEGIFNQITALRSVSFVEPDAVVIHPTDWQTIRLGKDSQNQYYGGGPFTGAYGNPGPSNQSEIWGLKACVTTAIAQGTALVGGYQECAQVFNRQGITLEMTNSNVDDFVNDLITLRAQTRCALAVYRPAGFGKVTLTA
jgi:HK97 family phage major capsid protein